VIEDVTRFEKETEVEMVTKEGAHHDNEDYMVRAMKVISDDECS
jgi:type IV secretory pathway VirJ component